MAAALDNKRYVNTTALSWKRGDKFTILDYGWSVVTEVEGATSDKKRRYVRSVKGRSLQKPMSSAAHGLGKVTVLENHAGKTQSLLLLQEDKDGYNCGLPTAGSLA